MRTHAIRVAVAAAAIALLTLVVWGLRPIAPDVSLGALYTIVVLAAAVRWGLPYALGASVVSLLTFNFFVLPPRLTLSLADARDWTALVVYLVTAVVASDLAARVRRRAEEAERRERDAALLADLAAALLERRETDFTPPPATDAAGRRLAVAVESLLAVATERERLEREAREAEALRESDAIKTAVIQAVSHDLRTPLATMEAALDGLQSLDLPRAERGELLETLRGELERLERLIENLLDLSRLQAGAATPKLELWTPDELVAQALDEIAARDRVDVDAPASLPAVRVDATQVQRVLVNVIENALKFSPPSSRVHVTVGSSGHDVVFRVADGGPGIDADDAEKIFQPFHRARGSGAGLGLAIARGFAAANGGRLSVEPALHGATLALALPAAELPARVPA